MSDTTPNPDAAPVTELPGLDPITVPPVTPDAKPRRTRRAKADTPPKGTGARARKPALAPRLTTSLVTIGTLVGLINQFDGLAICNGAPAFAEALAEAAEENPKLKAGLERMLSVGTLGKTFAAGAAIGVPIAANHGLIPKSIGGLFGAAPPEGESAAAA